MAEEIDEDVPTTVAIKCRRCPGWLTSEESKRKGVGPTCERKEAAEKRAAAVAGRELTLFEIREAEAKPAA
jgi:hypothetical protein